MYYMEYGLKDKLGKYAKKLAIVSSGGVLCVDRILGSREPSESFAMKKPTIARRRIIAMSWNLSVFTTALKPPSPI